MFDTLCSILHKKGFRTTVMCLCFIELFGIYLFCNSVLLCFILKIDHIHNAVPVSDFLFWIDLVLPCIFCRVKKRNTSGTLLKVCAAHVVELCRPANSHALVVWHTHLIGVKACEANQTKTVNAWELEALIMSVTFYGLDQLWQPHCNHVQDAITGFKSACPCLTFCLVSLTVLNQIFCPVCIKPHIDEIKSWWWWC